MDLVSPLPLFDLYNPEWPIHTGTRSLPPAKLVEHGGSGRANVNDTLLSLGVIVSGATVNGSVLSPGVTVGSGAQVERAILLDDVVVGPGARIRNAILDKNTVVPPGATIGYDRAHDEASGLVTSPNGVVVARKNSVVASD
jgi:glucose-1-phosphate adenylyltransferase